MTEIIARLTHGEHRTRDFFKFHLFKISPLRYIFYGVSLIFLIVSIVLILKMDIGSSLFFLFVALMVLVIRIAVTNIMLNGVVKKIHYDVISYQLKFKEDGVTYIDDIKSKTFSWNDFIVIYEVENYFYFYISKNSALILAKFVLDEEKRNKLREFIQNTNIKYKKKKFK